NDHYQGEIRTEFGSHFARERFASGLFLWVSMAETAGLFCALLMACWVGWFITSKAAARPPHSTTPLPWGFSQVFILKVVKVLCFDTLFQVFILKGLRCYAGSIEIGGVYKQKRGCLIAKLAAGFRGAVSNETNDTQRVIRSQPKNVPCL